MTLVPADRAGDEAHRHHHDGHHDLLPAVPGRPADVDAGQSHRRPRRGEHRHLAQPADRSELRTRASRSSTTLRYEMADEWIRAVQALWNSWEPGAVMMDEENGIFADHTKVHHADFKGRWYSTRGPLNTVPSPQHNPVICQAGGSPAGRAFAAKHADTVVASVASVDAMKEYRSDMNERLIDCWAQARRLQGALRDDAGRRRHRRRGAGQVRAHAGHRSSSGSNGRCPDCRSRAAWTSPSSISTDPFPTRAPPTRRGAPTERMLGSDLEQKPMTLRDSSSRPAADDQPRRHAGQGRLDRWARYMEEAGGDGFLISGPVTRRTIHEVADQLSPALRKRGLIRDGYSHQLLRDNLLAF